MFMTKEEKNMDLQIGEQAICSLHMNRKNIKKTYEVFVKTLSRIANMKKPKFKLLYEMENGSAGITSVEGRLMIAFQGQEETNYSALDYSSFDISSMADEEAVVFKMAEEFVEDLRKQTKNFAKGLLDDTKEFKQSEAEQKILQMADNIEKMIKTARTQYDIPEFIKAEMIKIETKKSDPTILSET